MEYSVFASAKRMKVSLADATSNPPRDADGWIVFIPASDKKDARWDDALDFLSAATRADLGGFAKRHEFKPKAEEVLVFDSSASLRVVVGVLPEKPDAFFLLETARRAIEPLQDAKTKRIVVDLRACGSAAANLAEAVAAANLVLLFEAKQYGDDPKDEKKLPELAFVGPKTTTLDLAAVRAAGESAAGTNLVRYLSGLAGNDLTPSRYVKLATELAREHGCKTEFFSLEKLTKLKAGAFLAVSRASADRGQGILKVTYRGAKPTKKVALVGKGITFDTGGTQLKQGEGMFGMNGDMGGSAVALALVLLAAQQKWPWEVSAWMAIAENSIGPQSYKPNDVVRTMSGKTIEVVDADAEGRMVLSDTLWLAGKDAPDLLMDFATLTGACVRAIGTNYSGAYTNEERLNAIVVQAGKMSGERVWPFPNDADYGRCLKSDIADFKQCRLTGGSDHIEAGWFLSQFVPKKTPWVHVDLSSAECDDGLGHVPTKLTGFGVRFAASFLRAALGT